MTISYANAPEQDIVIDLPDGKKIHGLLRGSMTDTRPMVIIIHGRPGTGNELLQFLVARHLYENGFSSLRLFLYDFGQEYRDMIDTTLDTHAEDLDVVVDYLRSHGVQKIFATGHSYGGLTILRSKSHLDGAVLWDPTHGLVFTDEFDDPNFPEKRVNDIVYVPTGCGFFYSQTQDDYDHSLGDNSNWAANKGYPIKFITAGKGILAPFVQSYYEHADEPKEIVDIPEAHHQFDDSDEVIERLFGETLEWFEQYKS